MSSEDSYRKVEVFSLLLKEWLEHQEDLTEHREDRIQIGKWGMCLQRGQVTEDKSRLLVLSLEKTTRDAVLAVVGENMLACRVGESSSR